MVNKYRTLISIILVCVMFLCFFAILGIFSAYSKAPTETISSSSSSSDPKDRLCTICGKNKYQFKDANGVRRCRECSIAISQSEAEAVNSYLDSLPKYEIKYPESSSSTVSEIDELEVKVTSFYGEYGYWKVDGYVKNNTYKTYYFIKLRAAFKDKDYNVLDTATTYACGDEGLAPGESTKFTIYADYDSKIEWVTVQVYDWM